MPVFARSPFRAAGATISTWPLIGPGAGGYLVKQINARGDGAIHAADFFRLTRQGLSEGIRHPPEQSGDGFSVDSLFG
jgi:hypothetical protein